MVITMKLYIIFGNMGISQYEYACSMKTGISSTTFECFTFYIIEDFQLLSLFLGILFLQCIWNGRVFMFSLTACSMFIIVILKAY
jgi:hypothetical protein